MMIPTEGNFMIIPRPYPTEVNRLATQAIDLRENEGISMLEAIQTVCSHAFIPPTDDAMTLGNVQAYLHQLQDAVTDEVYARKHHAADPAVIAHAANEN